MQRLVYTVDIDNEICELDYLHRVLNEVIGEEVGCCIKRSRLESSDEINEIGEWEDEDGQDQ